MIKCQVSFIWNTSEEKTMTQTLNGLELSLESYSTLERLAQSRNSTLSDAMENLLQQVRVKEQLTVLYKEYDELISKDFHGKITSQEEERLNEVCNQIALLDRQSEMKPIWEQRNKQADELIEKTDSLIAEIRRETGR
jgi:hypothetical protein